MKRKYWKLVGLVVFTGAMLCVVTYAGKCKSDSLPDAVKSAIQGLYPQGEIAKAKMEKEGLKVYEVVLKENGKEIEVTVGADGSVIEVGTEVGTEGLPVAVAGAIAQAAEGGKVEEVTKEVTYMVVKLVKLDAPETTYGVEVTKDGKKGEIEISADGKILEQKVGSHGDEEKKGCGKHNDKDEEEED
jgi:hypothetical protein